MIQIVPAILATTKEEYKSLCTAALEEFVDRTLRNYLKKQVSEDK